MTRAGPRTNSPFRDPYLNVLLAPDAERETLLWLDDPVAYRFRAETRAGLPCDGSYRRQAPLGQAVVPSIPCIKLGR